MKTTKPTTMATIALTRVSRQTIDEIKHAYRLGSVGDAVNQAISYVRENDPKLREMRK